MSAATSITTYLENTGGRHHPQRPAAVVRLRPVPGADGASRLAPRSCWSGRSPIRTPSSTRSSARDVYGPAHRARRSPRSCCSSTSAGYDFAGCATSRTRRRRCPTEHIRRLRALFPHVAIYSMYGLTECKRVSYLPPDQLDRPPDVGRPRHARTQRSTSWTSTAAACRPARWASWSCAARTSCRATGSCPRRRTRGASAGAGPRRARACTRATCSGWTRRATSTSSAGRDDIIKTRGEKVGPREVENVLYAHPGRRRGGRGGGARPRARRGDQGRDHAARGRRRSRRRKCCVTAARGWRTSWSRSTWSSSTTCRRPRPARSPSGAGRPPRRAVVSVAMPLSAAVLAIDAAAESGRIAATVRELVTRRLRRKGAVLGLSGGIDSSVAAALCVRALGPGARAGAPHAGGGLVSRQRAAGTPGRADARHPMRRSRTSGPSWRPPAATGAATTRSARWCPSTTSDTGARSCFPISSPATATPCSPSWCSRRTGASAGSA